MAEFSIRVQDAPVAESAAKWRAAQIVEAQPDGHEWGRKEVPPYRYILKCPEVSLEAAINYLQTWRHRISFSVLSSNLLTDTHEVEVSTELVAPNGKGALTREQVENYILGWGGAIQTVEPRRVVFTVSILDAIRSFRFWGADTSQVVLTETGYDPSSGTHTVRVDQSPYSQSKMAAAILKKGGTLLPPDSFSLTRQIVRQEFLEDIKENLQTIKFARRRFYISPQGMQALNNAGGVLTVTKQQLLNNIRDGAQDGN